MTVASGYLLHIGASTSTRADGSRYIGTALVGAFYLAAVMFTYITALSRGGFTAAWPVAHPTLRAALVLAVVLIAVAVTVVAVGMLPEQDEPASQMLWRRMIWTMLLALLLIIAGLAMFPKPWLGPALRLLFAGAPVLLTAAALSGCVLWYQIRASNARQQAERERPIPGLTAPRDPTEEARS